MHDSKLTQRISAGCQQLFASQQSLLLATASIEGLPDISYAPFVRDKRGVFYIYVSELADHTKNLIQNPLASVLFIQPETKANNIFARERMTLQCKVTEIDKNTEIYRQQLASLKKKFGAVVELISSLSDFHMMALQPQSGVYVAGFGKAYPLNFKDNGLLI